MSAFKVQVKKPINPDAMAAFIAGADVHEPIASVIKESVELVQPTPALATDRQTESLLFRLTKTDLDEFNFVFENTNVKSKQKLLESIILPEIARRAKELREGAAGK